MVADNTSQPIEPNPAIGAPAGGVGGVALLADELDDRHRKRGAYAMLASALRAGMAVPESLVLKAHKSAEIDLGDEEGRVRSAARGYVMAALKVGTDAAIAIDRIARLDSGQSTEQVTLTLMPPRLARLHANPDTGTE